MIEQNMAQKTKPKVKKINLHSNRPQAVLMLLSIAAVSTIGVYFLIQSFAATTFTSKITNVSGSLSLKKGSLGSWTKLNAKQYPRYTVSQLADMAPNPTRMCGIGPVLDARLTPKWVSCETWQETGWRQQGLTGVSGSAYSTRKDIMLVSWHNGTDSSARLTIMNTTTKKQIFVTLGAACDDGASGDATCSLGSTDKCGGTHAGGLAWYKSSLFLGDSDCIIVFNVNYIFKMPDGRYVLPSTAYWKRTTTSFAHSSLGVYTASTTPQLLSSEYESGTCGKTRFSQFHIDPATAQLKLNTGSTDTATSDGYHSIPQCYAQGLAYDNGMWFFNTSGSGTDYVYRYRTSATAPADTAFLMPKNTPQGIFIDKANGLYWSLTESPTDGDNNARVFNFPLAQLEK